MITLMKLFAYLIKSNNKLKNTVVCMYRHILNSYPVGTTNVFLETKGCKDS